MSDYKTVIYEVEEGGVARVRMNRPEVRNAQNQRMTYELNDALTKAAYDNDVKVIYTVHNIGNKNNVRYIGYVEIYVVAL